MVMISGCVVQHRELPEKTRYGKTYVTIGMPTFIVAKILKDAKGCGIDMQVKDKVQQLEGYHWMDCDTKRMSAQGCMIVSTSDDGAEIRGGSLDMILSGIKRNVQCTGLFMVTASQVTSSKDEKLDLDNGGYSISFKPVELYMIQASDVKGPILVSVDKRNKEKLA